MNHPLKLVTIAIAFPADRTLAKVLNDLIDRATLPLCKAIGGLLDDVSNLSEDARNEFGGPSDASVVAACNALAKHPKHQLES